MVEFDALFERFQGKLVSIDTLILVARYAVVAFVLRCLLVYGYRISIHPLSSYPGPFFAKFSDWYGAIMAMRMRLHITTYQDHQQYGPVMRHGPNKLVFSSVKALREIYQNPRLRKSRAYIATQRTPTADNILTILDKQVHRVRRRFLGHGLSQASLQKFEPAMTNHVDIFVKQLIASPQPVNVTNHCKRLGIDVIGELGFGASLKLQEHDTNRWILPGMIAMGRRVNYKLQFPALYYLYHQWLPHAAYTRLRIMFLLLRLIKTRLAEGTHAKNDLFSFIADFEDPDTGEKMKVTQLWNESIILFGAGGDTTTTAITALFFYLSRYPECRERLAKEIRGTFNKGSDIRSGPTLSSCVFLRACIDETLRMSSPAPGMLWREQEPTDHEPLIIDGHLIPRGTQIAVSTYTVHHDPEYFKDPFTFRPERWLVSPDDSDETKAARKRMQEAFVPFSIGTRSCAGKVMAYMEASLVIAKTMWYCDFDRSKGELDAVGAGGLGKGEGRERELEFQIYDIFVSTHDGPYLDFKVRDESWKDLIQNGPDGKA